MQVCIGVSTFAQSLSEEEKWRSSVETVHIVYMTHLDVGASPSLLMIYVSTSSPLCVSLAGFTDYSKNVLQLYFDTFFPAAIKTAQQLRALDREERWLVALPVSFSLKEYSLTYSLLTQIHMDNAPLDVT